MAETTNPVKQAIKAAGSVQALADLWDISREAVYGFRRQGYFPLPRAQDASRRFGIPLRDLVRPDIRAGMAAAVQDVLLRD